MMDEDKQGYSYYSGRWWSNVHNKAVSRGNVYVQLPDESPKEPITLHARVVYLGMYRFKQEEKIPVLFTNLESEASVKGYETPNVSVQLHPGDQPAQAPHGKGDLVFKIEKRIGNSNDTFQGSYTLSYPKDEGRFEIRKGTTHGEQCGIM